MGLRRKEQKYTAPGGHLDPKEDPLDGAVRELREESGIIADKKDLKFIKTIRNKENGYVVHGYRLDLSERPKTTMQGDPDQEVTRWNFVDTKTIPDEKLHVPRNHGNVLLPAMEKSAEKVKVPSFVNGDGLQYYLDKARALKTKIRE